MFKKITAIFIFLAVTFSLSGCSNLSEAKAAKGTGLSRQYSNSFDTVWNRLPEVLAELELPLAGENKKDGYILAQRGLTFFSYGENVAIFVDSIKPEDGKMKTKVEVVSKKAMATNIFAPNWDQKILDKLSEILNKS